MKTTVIRYAVQHATSRLWFCQPTGAPSSELADAMLWASEAAATRAIAPYYRDGGYKVVRVTVTFEAAGGEG